MKLLLDECLSTKLRDLLVGHDVFSARFMGWGGIKNGRLLALALEGDFDALITTDRGIEYEQNLQSLPIAVVILDAESNRLRHLSPLVPQLLAALNHLRPRAITHVP